ncbi:MAG: hypothetical protein DCF12_15405 [Snowella sp.]|jgi:hypothetical protein|nr:MAG: hypothetical protein DCF12_15405 [Snowella sp.]
MIQSVEAIIDPEGNVHLLESVKLSTSKKAIVTILEDNPIISISETALLSEASLAEDWLRPEEDEAWSHLQLAQFQSWRIETRKIAGNY